MGIDFRKNLNALIKKYLDGRASAAEIRFIENFYRHLDKNPAAVTQEDEESLSRAATENFAAIQEKIRLAGRKKSRYYYAAAAVLVALTAGIWFYTSQKELGHTHSLPVQAGTIDVMPGIDRALLILDNGDKVVLDQSTDEKTVSKGNFAVAKTKGGQLRYISSASHSATKDIAYHTLQTAKGNQYQLLLPDGTKVWLNAASSLRFPEAFVGAERQVELTGEGYFEVAKDKAHPFLVKTIVKGTAQQVKVLGTHFNINSYMDENTVKTTLLEGSVSVSNQTVAEVLRPGQQSNLDQRQVKVTDVDVDDETAWKNGLFRFNNSGLKSILNQLERWYDIRIDYDHVPNKRFNGMVPRKAKLSEVLKMLSLTGNISFSLGPDKTLTVRQDQAPLKK